MKKTVGIIMVVISLMAFSGWFIYFSQGKTDAESPVFYIFLLILFFSGIWMSGGSNSNKK